MPIHSSRCSNKPSHVPRIRTCRCILNAESGLKTRLRLCIVCWPADWSKDGTVHSNRVSCFCYRWFGVSIIGIWRLPLRRIGFSRLCLAHTTILSVFSDPFSIFRFSQRPTKLLFLGLNSKVHFLCYTSIIQLRQCACPFDRIALKLMRKRSNILRTVRPCKVQVLCSYKIVVLLCLIQLRLKACPRLNRSSNSKDSLSRDGSAGMGHLSLCRLLYWSRQLSFRSLQFNDSKFPFQCMLGRVSCILGILLLLKIVWLRLWPGNFCQVCDILAPNWKMPLHQSCCWTAVLSRNILWLLITKIEYFLQ